MKKCSLKIFVQRVSCSGSKLSEGKDPKRHPAHAWFAGGLQAKLEVFLPAVQIAEKHHPVFPHVDILRLPLPQIRPERMWTRRTRRKAAIPWRLSIPRSCFIVGDESIVRQAVRNWRFPRLNGKLRFGKTRTGHPPKSSGTVSILDTATDLLAAM